ncbi:MAG: primosomal protein N' [Verrucomicrobia bacterium]|nr:primosomal protein N' [Verrucomicrobiota bacterium]
MHPSQKPKYAGIILDRAVDKILDYSIPPHLQDNIEVGSRVVIPVKTSTVKGTVWHLSHETSIPNTKNILEIAIEPSVITKDLISLAKWMSHYYATPLYKILATVLPDHIKAHQKQTIFKKVVSLLPKEELSALALQYQSKAPSRAAILNVLLNKEGFFSVSALAQEAKTSIAPINTLIKQNILSLKESSESNSSNFEAEYFLSPAKKLSDEQQKSLDSIVKDMSNNSFSTHLIYGVTGSGKTEVYLQAIEMALSQDKGVIFLVPEVALATQTLERLKSRFSEKIAVLHHKVGSAEKKNDWHQIQSKKVRIIVGARSAIFSPIPNLGLIIIDEEQENSYKQSGGSPYYHARDVAIMRAKLCNAVAVLGSATPSLETYQNALIGKYTLSTLTHRPNTASLPKVHIIDMKEEFLKQKGNTLFSGPLLSAIQKRLRSGEQSLLLLNRRGYHTSQICLECSYTSRCPHCEVLLTFHLEENKLHCHLCNYIIPPPKICPSCQSSASMKFRGSGTEKVEKALYAIFPECRVLRMDADTTKKKGSHEALFKKFKSGKADILVGTQMIAKGLHFPSVTLVGVLNADTTLSIPDFRASESLFQLVTQVAGRSGRSDLPGEVFIQTLTPTQPTLLQAADQNYTAFFNEEAEIRKLFDYPPFTHLIKITLTGPDETLTRQKAEEVRAFLIQKLPPSFTFLPVAPSGHAKIENRYRFQFLLKSNKILTASQALLELGQRFYHAHIRLHIDIDPASTFF